MRYADSQLAEPLYITSDHLQHTLLFSVVLAFFIGMALLYLGIRGRVIWLVVWSVGLMLASLCYVGAYLSGMTGVVTA
jgi:hypothetical protein